MEILASTSTAASSPRLATLSAPKPHFERFGFRINPQTGLPSPWPQLRRVSATAQSEADEATHRYKWKRIGLNTTDAQKQAIYALPAKMTNRCQAVLKQIFCFSDDLDFSLPGLLAEWIRVMKPRRADWLAILKHLKTINHPLYIQVAEFGLGEESMEPNIRDYTKIIHAYGKQNRIEKAEATLAAMKSRGFLCDQVTLTAFVDMYSKAGNLSSAEKTFDEIKLLGEPVDKRSYGAMAMAYVRAELPEKAEALLREMDSLEIFAGSEVYKAVLRAYSMGSDAEGAQRVFDAAQLAGVLPDARLCGLVINAWAGSGRGDEARAAFENMRRAGIWPSDRCVALVLKGYEMEGRPQRALEFVAELERDNVGIGREAAETLVSWFGRLGVVEEIELVLRDFGGLGLAEARVS